MPPRLKLAVIGDPHIAVPHGDNDTRLEVDPGRKLHGLSVELLQATVDAVNAEPGVDSAIVMGDLTRDSELFNHEIASKLLAQLIMPYYIVIGNHDCLRKRPDNVTYPGVKRLDRDDLGGFYHDHGLPGGMTRYVVELPGNVMLVVVDSNRTLGELSSAGEELKHQDEGWMSDEQLAWLDGILAQIRSGGRLPLVALHHTIMDHSPAEKHGHLLYRVFRYWQLHDAIKLRHCLVKHQVPLVLSGHMHAQSVGICDGITNLATAATVSYPHSWNLLAFDGCEVHIESRRITEIPSVPALQEKSHKWMAEGMGQLIEEKVRAVPLAEGATRELRDFIVSTGWWTRFCDGTLSGFSVNPSDIPQGNALTNMIFNQVVNILNEYGTWKSERPDPNQLSIPLEGDS